MDTFMNIVTVIGVVGVWIYIIWIGATVKNLKSMTDATKNIFDSLKTSSDYQDTVHKTAQSLHDPTVIENVVNLRVELKQEENKKIIEGLERKNKEIKTVLKEAAKRLSKSNEQSEITEELAGKLIASYEELNALYSKITEWYENELRASVAFASFAFNNLTKEQLNMFLNDEENKHLMKEGVILFGAIEDDISEKKETT